MELNETPEPYFLTEKALKIIMQKIIYYMLSLISEPREKYKKLNEERNEGMIGENNFITLKAKKTHPRNWKRGAFPLERTSSNTIPYRWLCKFRKSFHMKFLTIEMRINMDE